MLLVVEEPAGRTDAIVEAHDVGAGLRAESATLHLHLCALLVSHHAVRDVRIIDGDGLRCRNEKRGQLGRIDDVKQREAHVALRRDGLLKRVIASIGNLHRGQTQTDFRVGPRVPMRRNARD